MNSQVASLVTGFLYVLVFAIIIRSLMSWFPAARDSSFARVVYQLTEPLMSPVRRVLPRFGMIDLSAMVVIIILYVMIAAVSRIANQ